MPTVITRIESHAQQKEKSYSNLNKSRELVADYKSETTRQKLVEACLERCNHRPHSWQLDADESFHLGLDCIILAGTGFGKTLPFVMPLMLDTEKILLVISPLNTLEVDQVTYLSYDRCGLSQIRRSCELGLRAVAVNHGTYTTALHRVSSTPSRTP